MTGRVRGPEQWSELKTREARIISVSDIGNEV